MEKSDFDLLLKRYLTGQVSEAERIKVETWLEVMKTEDPDALELSRADEEKIFRRITANRDNVDEIKAFIRERKKPSATGWIFPIAASVMLIATVSYLGWQIGTDDHRTLAESAAGNIEKIILNDGSLVWLKGDSKLVHYRDEKKSIRYTELTGEALFEVAEDAQHPFVVRCGAAMLRVLGTSFNVKARHDSLEVSVLTGRVEVSVGPDKATIDAVPNDRIVYTGRGGLERKRLDTTAIISAIARTEYDMQFANIALDQAIEKLQKKFNVEITLADKKAGACKITVDLTGHSLEQSLQMITEVLDVTYRRDGEGFLISGSGCNDVSP
jgi:ferric-dicitrate binding protein FerR (iron transport regulator)